MYDALPAGPERRACGGADHSPMPSPLGAVPVSCSHILAVPVSCTCAPPLPCTAVPVPCTGPPYPFTVLVPCACSEVPLPHTGMDLPAMPSYQSQLPGTIICKRLGLYNAVALRCCRSCTFHMEHTHVLCVNTCCDHPHLPCALNGVVTPRRPRPNASRPFYLMPPRTL